MFPSIERVIAYKDMSILFLKFLISNRQEMFLIYIVSGGNLACDGFNWMEVISRKQNNMEEMYL